MKLILLLVLCAPFIQSQVTQSQVMQSQVIQSQGPGPFSVEGASNIPDQKIAPRDQIMAHVYGSLELSRSVQVAGAVKEPLTFQASAPVTLLEAITRAGGLTPGAGSEIRVSKSQAGPGGSPASLVKRVSVKALIDGTDPEVNLRLYGGEEVRVPEAGKVFIVGNVKKAGAFAVEEGAETSVLRMLALAEGRAPFAGSRAYIYRRGNSGTKNETKHEISIELSNIMDRKAPDVTLLANDILYIPDSRNPRLGLVVLEKLLLFGSMAEATPQTYDAR